MADIINFADYYTPNNFNYNISKRFLHLRKKSKPPSPERQGSLDGLCGIYSVINAINYTARLSQKQRDGLFKQLIRAVKKGYDVDKCILYGTDKKLLLFMFQAAQNYLGKKYKIKVKINPLFNPRAKPDKQRYLTTLSDFLSGDNRILIVGLSGMHEHWTCITAITPKTIRLLDSDGLYYLRTANCYVRGKFSDSSHLLIPSKTWGIYLNNDRFLP
ncbi:MAG: hypothetical protein R3D71_09990 [Rickettsiales bacterium]